MHMGVKSGRNLRGKAKVRGSSLSFRLCKSKFSHLDSLRDVLFFCVHLLVNEYSLCEFIKIIT